MRRALALGLALGMILGLAIPGLGMARHSQTPPDRWLIPLGGGYSDLYGGFAQTVIAHARDGAVKVVILPTTYSSNPDAITVGERQTNMRDAERRRAEIEGACQRAAPAGVTCTAVIAPIFVRADALDPANARYFAGDITAVFILGGDQGVAMRALANTPAEQALAQAYQRGVIVAGTSAGCGMLAVTMLADYSPNFAAANALNFGSTQLWNTADQRGLSFGLPNAILDQHFFQRSRVGRLLEAISRPGAPQIGIGCDAYTGVHIRNDTRLENVIGLYTIAVLDAQTYHAADAVQYRGPNHTLSLRNILVHLLAPGNSWYDLAARQHSLGAPAPQLNRAFDALALPAGAGPLILGGNLTQTATRSAVLARFKEWVGHQSAPIVLMVAGYPNDAAAQRAAAKLAGELGVPTETLIVSKGSTEPLALRLDCGGIVFVAPDQSLLPPDRLTPLKDVWLAGKPVLADDGAAAAMGAFFSAHGPTPSDADEAEIATQKSFRQGGTTIRKGLGALNLMVEPHVLGDNRWGRLFSLAYDHPDLLAVGLNENTALEITGSGVRVLGDHTVLVLDLRTARRDLGSNQGYVIANGLLDVFAPGDAVQPQAADVSAAPQRAATPVIAPPTATPKPTSTPPPSPTLAPSPSPSPAATPIASAGLPVEPPVALLAGGVLLALLGVGAALALLRQRAK